MGESRQSNIVEPEGSWALVQRAVHRAPSGLLPGPRMRDRPECPARARWGPLLRHWPGERKPLPLRRLQMWVYCSAHSHFVLGVFL